MIKATRRAVLGCVVGAVVAAAAVGAPAIAQEAKTAKLGHSFTDSHPRAAAMKRFAEEVAKTSNGSVKISSVV